MPLIEMEFESPSQGFSNVNILQRSWKAGEKTDCWAPLPEFLIQFVEGEP